MDRKQDGSGPVNDIRRYIVKSAHARDIASRAREDGTGFEDME